MCYYAPAVGGQRALSDTVIRRSVCPYLSQLGYRNTGCVAQLPRLSARWLPAGGRPPDMCGRRTRPRTDVAPPRVYYPSQPLYLSELISHYLPPRSLHSSNTNLLTRPAGITINFSSRTFSVSAPSTRNSLPAQIRSIDTLTTFKRHLKFHLFQSAFTV